ncbi:hypothetical protein DFA_08105 [Cavenderia fasciculata]|uniref:Serine aminopeptidase S33 domain-containing protein n=1 Tax=Cavenderia fasciculata TaxID=261658 RepID=F4Q564_CACFS|nr:uncharacterized protein DFA_08105 [Cavenderia fasciculata]EGG17123.1 hypothetical protein DFA_08105 [Cavenderia fasciculata]|eukprot:XP_004355607.1 hypothetical protein DFA_08105 [Cavenderia fasciculata]
MGEQIKQKKPFSKTQCIVTLSVVMLVISLSLTGVFVVFVSKALLYFPWMRGIVMGSGDPMTKHGLSFQEVEWKAYDTNQTLRGWWIPADSKNDLGNSIIVVHGSGKDRYEWFEQLNHFHEEGLSTLVFDCRDGMGKSDSLERGIGYSFREHKDVRSAIRYVKSTYPEQSKKLILTGMSMGGGSVIIAAAKDRDLIDGVISESAYASPMKAWKHNIYRYLSDGVAKTFKVVEPVQHLLPTHPPQWLVDLILRITLDKIIASEDNLSQYDTPENLVAQISPKPILFIAATEDPVVPYDQSETLFRVAKEPKELWTIESNRHSTAVHISSHEAYRAKLHKFIQSI